MQPATGFSSDSIGLDYYISLCKKNGLLPVGCGTSGHNCDLNRHKDEPCIPMPSAWGCRMIHQLKQNTGWGDQIVAMHADASYDLITPNGNPNKTTMLQPVCGKITGMC